MEYTDIEQRILDMWPKFEDGNYVQLGDKAVANSGENSGKEFTVRNVYFENGHGKLRSSALDGCYWNWKSADTRVKRPAPKVLDADGVEIKVGDRIYSIENGNSYIVRAIHGSGTLEFEGFEYKGWFPRIFTHKQPVRDIDGVLIKVGDKVWVDGVSESCEVAKVESGIVQVQYADGDTFECCSSDITHEQPDSWERLEEDVEKSTCEYFGFRDKECSECPGLKGGVKGCSVIKMRDLVRRAKAIAEKEAGL